MSHLLPAIGTGILRRMNPASPEGIPGEAAPRLSSCDLPWLELHGLLGVAYHLVQAGELCPENGELTRELRRRSRCQEFEVERRLAQAAELGDRLSLAGVPGAILKGPTLAACYYPFPGMRNFGDIDLLVALAHREEAQAALASLGYAWQSDPAGHSQEYLREHHYHWAFGRPDSLLVELHWNMAPPGSGLQCDTAAMVARSVVKRTCFGAFRMLAAEDDILLMAVHAAKHQFRVPLRAYLDLAVVAQRSPDLDWTLLLARAQASGATDDLAVFLAVAQSVGLVSLPCEVEGWLAGQNLPAEQLAAHALDWPWYNRPEGLIHMLSAPMVGPLLSRVTGLRASPALDLSAPAVEPSGSGVGRAPGKSVGRLVERLRVLHGRDAPALRERAILRAASFIRQRFFRREPA